MSEFSPCSPFQVPETHKLNSDPLLVEHDAASFLGVSVSTLRRLRASDGGPAYIRIGHLIRYRESALEAYLEQHTIRPLASGPAHSSTKVQ
jgi:excisionase family DNA binding protein